MGEFTMKILERVYFKQAIDDNETASNIVLPTYTLPPPATTSHEPSTTQFLLNYTTPQQTTYSIQESPSLIGLCISIAYIALFVVGLIGNISVLMTTCRKGTSKHQQQRHLLILSLALADLSIIVVCYPTAVLSLVMPYLVLPYPFCHAIATVQGALHAASNFSMAFLAFDRYLTLRKPKTASKLAKWTPRGLIILWFSSCLLTVPVIFIAPNMPHAELANGIPMCSDVFPWTSLYIAYYSVNALTVYIIPGAIVWTCNLQVGASLQQRRLEEMKLQARPRQTIIIAKDCTIVGPNKHKIVADESSFNDSQVGSDTPKFHFAKPDNIHNGKTFSKSKIHLRPSKSMKTIIRAHRRLRVRKKFGSAMLSEPKPQSVETRLKLARLLKTLVWLYTFCWTPYAISKLVWPLLPTSRAHLTLSISLVIGQSHSSLSVVIYWLMNRSIVSSVRQWVSSHVQCPPTRDSFTCGCCGLWKCLAKPPPTPWVNNSSTNLNALGPFHPKYVNPFNLRPQPSRCTSHYFH